MKNLYIYIILTAVIITEAKAQEGNNWVAGFKGGLNFSTDPPTDITTSICAKGASGMGVTQATGAISDCLGNLLFYTNGVDLWNRYHQLTPHGSKMNNYTVSSGQGSNAAIIPYPGQDSTYLMFSMRYYYEGVTVNKIKLQLDSGRGDVDTTYPIHFFSQKSYFASWEFKYIKQSDSLYWIINIIRTKTNNSNYYSDSLLYCYRVDKNGVDTVPVITTLNNGMQSSFVDVSNKGDKLVLYGEQNQFSGYKPFVPAVTIYDFDKNTGKISNPGDLLLTKYIYGSSPVNGAFSPNDSFLYVVCIESFAVPSSSWHTRIIQIPLYSSTKNKFYNVNMDSKHVGRLRLMPNNKIIIWDTLGCIIKYPNRAGKLCKFDSNYVRLSIDDMASSLPPVIYSPKIIIDYTTNSDTLGCTNDSVRFQNNSDTGFLSFRWYFGDGDSLDAKDAAHFYKKPGRYFVTLSGLKNNCGYRLVRSDSIDVFYRPKVQLAKKDIYTCGAHKAQTTILYKFTDTLHLYWGDGKDTVIYTKNNWWQDSVIISHTYNSGNYILAAHTANSNCQDSTALLFNVNIHPKVIPLFTPNYITSCGNSTITLADSSGGKDSVIQQRKWTIEYPNNITKQYDTVTTNKLKLIVQDTGYYNAKLIYITKQGCVDSLYKTKVFRILPQPVWLYI